MRNSAHFLAAGHQSQDLRRQAFTRRRYAFAMVLSVLSMAGCGSGISTAVANTVVTSTSGKAPEAPAVLASLSCGAATLVTGSTTTCQVQLRAAVTTGTAIAVTPDNLAVTAPATVTVAASSTSAAFSLQAAAVVTSQPVVLTATLGTQSASFAMQVTPPVIQASGDGQKSDFGYSASPMLKSMQAPSALPIPKEWLGMTVANLAPNSLYPQPNMTPFPALPVATFRFWDVAHWAMMEPVRGQMNWSKIDNTLLIAQQHGVSDFIFTFGRVPAWASTNPTDPCTDGEGAGTCTAPDLDALDSFATKVVQRYCGKIKNYEPWNEPDGPAFWDGTNAQMLAITQHIAKIVKDPANCGCTDGKCSPNGGANPNKLLLAPISNLSPSEVQWLDAYLTSAGPTYPYADVAAFHGYVWTGYQPEEIADGVALLRQTLAKHGLQNLELWNTEVSWEANSKRTEEEQTAWLMRYQTTQPLLGVSRVLW